MGGDWRMPENGDLYELIQNCSFKYTTLKGVNGVLFTSKTNGNTIFMPRTGVCQNNSIEFSSDSGYYLSSTKNETWARYMKFAAGSPTLQNYGIRSDGYAIRAVREAPKAVDLGLPSGTLWADRNVDATAPTDYGSYFSWGNIDGHKSSNGSTFDDSYDFGSLISGPYASTPGASLTADIASNDAAHDAALAILGGSWRMPTTTEFQELYDNTDNEWTTINGVNGRKFMKKSDHSVYVFFPATGIGYGTSLGDRGSRSAYWSSSLDPYNRPDYGRTLYFSSSDVVSTNKAKRFYGYSVRAVQ